MQQRMEFALKALKSENFRRLCQEYGINTKTGTKCAERRFCPGEDSMRVAWHEVPGSVKERMTRPVGTAEIAVSPRHIGLEFLVVPF